MLYLVFRSLYEQSLLSVKISNANEEQIKNRNSMFVGNNGKLGYSIVDSREA